MGYYTQLKLSVTLSEQAPLEVIKKLCDGTMEQELFTLKFGDGPRKKYEDIELDCLKKLIEIVTNKN